MTDRPHLYQYIHQVILIYFRSTIQQIHDACVFMKFYTQSHLSESVNVIKPMIEPGAPSTGIQHHSHQKFISSIDVDSSDSIMLSLFFFSSGISLIPFSSFPSAAVIQSWNLKQLVRWSFVIPATCMKEQMTVGPTLRKPLLTKSLLMTSAFGVLPGSCRGYLNLLTIGLWFTKLQIYLSNDPNSSITWHHQNLQKVSRNDNHSHYGQISYGTFTSATRGKYCIQVIDGALFSWQPRLENGAKKNWNLPQIFGVHSQQQHAALVPITRNLLYYQELLTSSPSILIQQEDRNPQKLPCNKFVLQN